MKVKQRPSYYGREEDLRVSVLRRTVPKSYFKYKAKLIKTLTKEAAMQLLNDIKQCKSFLMKSKRKQQQEVKSEQAVEVQKLEPNYRLIAKNFMRKFGIGNQHSGQKTIVDEKGDKVARLLYF